MTVRRLIRGLGEPILAVGLVAPRPDVFDPRVKYLLVVCATTTVRVFAATFEVRGGWNIDRPQYLYM